MTAPEVFLAEGVHTLGDGLSLLTAPCSPRQTASAWQAGGPAFGDLSKRLDGDLVLDLGRGPSAGAPEILERLADRFAFVVRSALPDLAALVATLREHDSEPASRLILVVDPVAKRSTVNPREVREVLAPFGHVLDVSHDPAAINALRTDPMRRRWTKSRFGSVVADAVTWLLAATDQATEVTNSIPVDTHELQAVVS